MAFKDIRLLKDSGARQPGLKAGRLRLAGVVSLLLLIGCGGFAFAYRTLSGIRHLGVRGVTFQRSGHDCGQASLRMILDHFGVAGTYEDLAGVLSSTSAGATMLDIKELAESRGLRSSGWRITAGDLHCIPLPAIAFLRRSHFVVLDQVEDDGDIIVRDPARGKLWLSSATLRAVWGGEILLFAKAGATAGRHGRWFADSSVVEREIKQ